MKFIRFLEKHAPTILASAGVVGTIATAILSAKGHYKAMDILEEEKKGLEEGEKLDFKTCAKKTWKEYAPAVATGTVTIACIIAGNRISAKEIAVLSATAGYLAKNRDQLMTKFNELKSKVLEKAEEKGLIEEIDPIEQEIDKKYQEDLLKEYKRTSHPCWEYTGDGTMRVVDLYSGRCFLSSPEAVRKAGTELNKLFEFGGAVCLSDWYELLGIRKTTFGNDYGWPMNKDYFDGPIMFNYEEVIDDDGMPIMFVDIWTPPIESWAEV